MSGEREIAAEDSIRVVCRFRPLNDSEEKAGSKFVVKFPSDDNCISIGVSVSVYISQDFPSQSSQRFSTLLSIYRYATVTLFPSYKDDGKGNELDLVKWKVKLLLLYRYRRLSVMSPSSLPSYFFR